MAARMSTWVVRTLLRSPLHALVSDRLILLTVIGRESGRRYTFPVRYTIDGRAITVVADEADRKTWWLNVARPAPVLVRLRGRDRNAIAQIEWDAPETDRALDGRPNASAARIPMPALAGGGGVAVATLAPILRDAVVVRIALTADLG
jgi:hypothetical protein